MEGASVIDKLIILINMCNVYYYKNAWRKLIIDGTI